MDELELANRFDHQRPQLRAVAYRILGSVTESEDAVQEAWLRLQRTDAEQIDSLERWLTTVVARICLNMLRSRGTRGEQPLEHLRPEPIIDDPAVGTDPEHEALLADSVGIALQVVLDTLRPAERLRVRAPRHVRRAIWRDRGDGRPFTGGDPPARQPRPPPCARGGAAARPGPDPPAGGRRCLLRRLPGGRPR